MPGYDYNNNPQKLQNNKQPAPSFNQITPNPAIPKNNVGAPPNAPNENAARDAINARNQQLLQELNQTIQKLNIFNNTPHTPNNEFGVYDPKVLIRIKHNLSKQHYQQKNTPKPKPELSSLHFQKYIKEYPNLRYKSLILGFNLYITNQDGTSLKQPTRNDIIDYLGKNIADYNVSNKNNPLNESEAIRWIETLKNFFRWIESEGVYNNFTQDISYQEVQNKSDIIYNGMPQSKSEKDLVQGQAINFGWAKTYFDSVREQKGEKFDPDSIFRLNKFMKYLEDKGKTQPQSQDIHDFLINHTNVTSESSIQVYLSTLNGFFQWTADKTKKQQDIYYPNIKLYCLPYMQIRDLIKNRIIEEREAMEEGLKTASLDPKCINTFITEAKTSETLNLNTNSQTVIESFQEYLREFNITRPLTLDILIFFGKYKEKISDIYVKYALPTFNKFFQWTSTHKDKQGKILYPNISTLLPTSEQVFLFIQQVKKERDEKIGKVDFDMAYFDEFITGLKNPRNGKTDSGGITKIKELKDFFNKKYVIGPPRPQYTDIIDFFVQRKSLKSAGSMGQYLAIFKKFFRWTSIKKKPDGQIYYPNITSNMPIQPMLKVIVDSERAKQQKQ